MILALIAVLETVGVVLVVAALVFAAMVMLVVFLPSRPSRKPGPRPAATGRMHARHATPRDPDSVARYTPMPCEQMDVTDRAVPVASPPAAEVGGAEQLLPADRWYAVALAGLLLLVAPEEGVHLAVGVLLVVGPAVVLVIGAGAARDRRRGR